MDSIHREPDKGALPYSKMQGHRSQEWSEQEIARKLGYNSPQAMYVHFRQQGFPICEVCGVYSKEDGHCGRERQATGAGARSDVPPAVRARELFRDVIERLAAAVEELDLRREHRQGELFVASEFASSMNVITPDMVSEEKWRELCEAHDKDLDADRVIIRGGSTSPLGGSYYPPEPLTTLIGAYLVAGDPPESLVKALHLDPQQADLEDIHKKLEGKDGLLRRKEQLAALVYGGRGSGQGRRPPSISREEQNAAYFITQRRAESASDENILHELRNKPRFLKELKKRRQVKMDDVQRLGNFHLNPPPS